MRSLKSDRSSRRCEPAWSDEKLLAVMDDPTLTERVTSSWPTDFGPSRPRRSTLLVFGSGLAAGILIMVVFNLVFLGGSNPNPNPQAQTPAGATGPASASAGPAKSAKPSTAPSAAEFVPGAKPNASNTGVPKGTPLEIVKGDLVVTTDGAVIEGKDVHGFLQIRADNVTVRNTIVRGRKVDQNDALVSTYKVKNTLLEHIEVDNQFISPWVDGVWGDNFTIRYSNIHGTVDGMKVESGSRVEGNYIHDLSFLADDPNHSDGTHNDGIQILNGSDIEITGNNFDVGKKANAAIQVTQDFGKVSKLSITKNWANGGACTFNFAHKIQNSLTVKASGNIFGHDTFFDDCPMLISSATKVDGSGNIYEDSKQPINVQQHD